MTTHELAFIPVGPFAVEGAPTLLDARCVRLALVWPTSRPLCCAHGVDIDARARLQLVRRVSLRWSTEGPRQRDSAPSGVVARLDDVEWTWRSDVVRACAALADPAGGVRGDGCVIRSGARDAGLAEDVWLLDACAIFPLDLRHGALVPSPRIPDDALTGATHGAPTLWDDACARVAHRWGVDVARAIDDVVAGLRAHRARAIHLKTLK